MPTVLSFLAFTFTILYQPPGAPFYIFPIPKSVTSFANACCGNIGLLAHVEQSGIAFFDLNKNDIITLEYSDHEQRYVVIETREYVADNPNSIYSNFQNVETGEWITSLDLATELYHSKRPQLVLQTCFDGTNGRLFVIAIPIQKFDRSFAERTNEYDTKYSH